MSENEHRSEEHEEQKQEGESTASEQSKKTGKSKASFGLLLLVVIILAVAVVVILDRVVGVNIFTTPEQREQQENANFVAETGTWNAVFLSNGQVYFGQLENPEAQYALIRDVYYLQLQQSPQAATGQAPVIDPNNPDSQVVSAPQPEPPRLTLIKFGTEIHGPEDFIQINRDHILFYEELKVDSGVVKAIREYKENLNQ